MIALSHREKVGGGIAVMREYVCPGAQAVRYLPIASALDIRAHPLLPALEHHDPHAATLGHLALGDLMDVQLRIIELECDDAVLFGSYEQAARCVVWETVF